MPKKLLSILFFSSLAVLAGAGSVYGQADFKAGYVLPLGADTLRGQVQQLGPQRSQRECVFRAGAAAPITYSVTQLRGYGFTPGPALRRGRVVRGNADTATVLRFQEVLAAGRATLLYASDEDLNQRYYLQMAGAPVPTELRQIKRRLEDQGRISIQTINQYQQVLLTSLADCPALATDIRRSRLSESELVKIVRRYNACVAPAGTVAASGPAAKASVTISLVAGLGFRQRMPVQSSFSDLRQYNQNLTTPLSVVPGVQLVVRNPRLSRHLGFGLGILLHRLNYENTLPGQVINSFVTADRIETAYHTDFVSLPLTISGEFGRGWLRPFVEAGGSADFRLKVRRNEYTTFYTTNGRPPDQRVLFDNTNGFTTSLLAGAGLLAHRPGGHELALRLRYVRTGAVAPYIYISTISSSWRLLLSYSLTKN